MASPKLPLPVFDPRNIVYTHPRYLPGSRFHDVHISDSIICEGCRLKNAVIKNSIVGIRNIIRSGARIERSVIMGADHLEDEEGDGTNVPVGIGRNATIVNAIVDKNARIGDNVSIHGAKRLRDADGPGYAIRDGIVIVLKNAVIPAGTRIG